MSMDQDNATSIRRPLPKRPPTGWMAWEATLGYISTQYSPDAMLKLQVYPDGSSTHWCASVSWGQNEEQVQQVPSLAAALGDLWREVERHHMIFTDLQDAVKMPANYPEDRWVEPRALDTIQRLIQVNAAIFKQDWQLIVVYQPNERPETRVQARLLAANNSVHIGGRGGSLYDACHGLYTNAAPTYAAYRNK